MKVSKTKNCNFHKVLTSIQNYFSKSIENNNTLYNI